MRHWLFREGYRTGFATGLAKVRGRALGMATAVLRILELRGIAVPEEVRERILSCIEPWQLNVWVDRAAVAPTLEQVLAEPLSAGELEELEFAVSRRKNHRTEK